MRIPTDLPPRPKSHDKETRELAAKKLAPRVHEWCKTDGEDEFDLADIEELLAKEMAYGGMDGYDLANRLDGDLSPDAELVSILDGASHAIYEAETERCEAWAKEHKLEGPAIGAMVRWKSNPGAGEGRVTHLHSGAKASVYFPALGHVDPDVPCKPGNGTLGSVIPWEDIEI